MTLRACIATTLLVPLTLALVLLAGCESNSDSTITTSLFNREPGTLRFVSVDPDSIGISQYFQEDITETSGLFAGSYESAEAFTIFKFSRPGQTVIDSLESATVTLNVANIWGGTSAAFALYSIAADWDEEDDIDSDALLGTLGEPIQTIIGNPDSLPKLVFNIPGDLIEGWVGSGAFLLKGTPEDTNMIRVSSDNSTNTPKLKIYHRKTNATIDSTIIQNSEARYVIDTGLPDDAPVVSNGNAQGYVLNIGIPELSTNPIPINRSALTFSLGDHLFVDSGMTILLYRLTAEFTTFDAAETDLSTAISVVVTADSTTYNINISPFLNEWINLGEPNYGILVKPYNTSTKPNYAILTPADSLTIVYTTLPEVP